MSSLAVASNEQDTPYGVVIRRSNWDGAASNSYLSIDPSIDRSIDRVEFDIRYTPDSHLQIRDWRLSLRQLPSIFEPAAVVLRSRILY